MINLSHGYGIACHGLLREPEKRACHGSLIAAG